MLVSVVYAELLEAVLMKIFETEYIQNADRAFLGAPRLVYRGVYLLDDHYEETTVDRFDESVSHLAGLNLRQIADLKYEPDTSLCILKFSLHFFFKIGEYLHICYICKFVIFFLSEF